MKIKNLLTFIAKLVMFSLLMISCNSAEEIDNLFPEDETTNTVVETNVTKSVRIVQSGAGSQTEVDTLSLVAGQTYNLKASLYDENNTFLEDIAVDWSLDPSSSSTNGTFSSASGATTTFTASSVGTSVIKATYTGSDDVDVKSDITGEITVAGTGVATTIAYVSGTNVGTVDTNLPPLGVKVTDSNGFILIGEEVQFTILQGNGSIQSVSPEATPVVAGKAKTDSDGIAYVTYKLGTLAGTNQNLIRAAVVSNTSIKVDIAAEATVGAISQLSFSTQPGDGFTITPLETQPVVRVEDAYSNLVSTASGTVNLSLKAGTGSGNLTNTSATLSGGVATFSDLTYDSIDLNIVLVANYTSGSVSATGESATFDIASAPEGACVVEDSYFRTSLGGCKDQNTGLTWSKKSPSKISWYDFIWDSTVSGASTPETSDQGRTNDFGTDNGYYIEPTNSTDYCHSLVESGIDYWRMPNVSEVQTMLQNQQNGPAANYLESMSSGNLDIATSTLIRDNQYAFRYKNSPTALNVKNLNHTAHVYCVLNNDYKAANKLKVFYSDKSIGVNNSLINSIIVGIVDEDDNPVHIEDQTVTISTNLGLINGLATVSTQTDIYGRASFDNITFNTQGSHTLTFESSGLTSATATIVVGSQPNTCADESAALWATQNGGCEFISQGLVISLLSSDSHSWHDAVWDQDNPGPNAGTADADDNGRTDDYEDSPSTHPDNSPINYCHDLNHGGYTDWRLLSNTEYQTLTSNGLYNQLGFTGNITYMPGNTIFTSKTLAGDPSRAWAWRLYNGSLVYQSKLSQVRIFCIRNSF